MVGQAQTHAYAHADFTDAHTNILRHFENVFPDLPEQACAIDLGCGSADITIRVARLYSGWQIDALDGSAAMLAHGRHAIKSAGLEHCVCLKQSVLPDKRLPVKHYDIVVSNSLLHHLHDPQVLWDTIKSIAKPGAYVFIADLRRPHRQADLIQLVEEYAGDEPDILRQDFYNSLFAAFMPEEVRQQLRQAALSNFQVVELGNRHLTVYGIVPE